MATTTVRTEFAVVNIIGQVTVRATIAGLAHRGKRAAMAAFACNASVRAVQLEVGLRIVIEQPQVPGDRVVTRLAVAFKNTFMVVVFEVAVDTGVGSVREELRLMTVIAFNVRVFA